MSCVFRSNKELKYDSINLDKLISLLLTTRNEAKQNKDWATADKIRDELSSYGIAIKDTKDGSEWEIVK